MLLPWEILERDHDLQNPTSPAKIRLLGEYLRLTPQTSVLDVACGKAGPALILAAEHGCRIHGIELRSGFADAARKRIASAGLERLIEIETADASATTFEPAAYDVALCLGASFVWGTIADAAAVLAPVARPGGFVAIGEPFWLRWPLPEGVDTEDYVSLAATVERFESAGLRMTGVIASSRDDWDRYESLHWRVAEEWLVEHPDDPHAAEMRAGHENARRAYLQIYRPLLAWAIFVGRVTRG